MATSTKGMSCLLLWMLCTLDSRSADFRLLMRNFRRAAPSAQSWEPIFERIRSWVAVAPAVIWRTIGMIDQTADPTRSRPPPLSGRACCKHPRPRLLHKTLVFGHSNSDASLLDGSSYFYNIGWPKIQSQMESTPNLLLSQWQKSPLRVEQAVGFQSKEYQSQHKDPPQYHLAKEIIGDWEP